MGPIYVVIPENHMNKTFRISCRMPWLRNDNSLYWSPLLIRYGCRVFGSNSLVRSVHSGLWSKQQSTAWLTKSCSGDQKRSVTGDLSNRLCFQSSRWPFIRWFTWSPVSPTYCFLQLMHGAKWTTLVVLQLVLHLSLMVAPDLEIVGVIILQVLHLALPHGRVSPSGSSSRMSGLSLACTRRTRRLLGLL